MHMHTSIVYSYAQHVGCSMCFRIHAHHSCANTFHNENDFTTEKCASYATITPLKKWNKNAIQNWDVTNCEFGKWVWLKLSIRIYGVSGAIQVMEFWNVHILMCNNFTYISTHSVRSANFWLIFVQFGIIRWVLLAVQLNIWIRWIEVTLIQLCWCKSMHTNLNWIGLDWIELVQDEFHLFLVKHEIKSVCQRHLDYIEFAHTG